jgi:hypothetical protein
MEVGLAISTTLGNKQQAITFTSTRGATGHLCALGNVWMLRSQWNTIFTSHSKLEYIYSVEAQHKTQHINIFMYNCKFTVQLPLTDANSSITSLILMVTAISYSLLERQLPRERIWPSVLRLWLDVSQKWIPQGEEFTDIEILLLVTALPAAAPRLSTPRRGSDCQDVFGPRKATEQSALECSTLTHSHTHTHTHSHTHTLTEVPTSPFPVQLFESLHLIGGILAPFLLICWRNQLTLKRAGFYWSVHMRDVFLQDAKRKQRCR